MINPVRERAFEIMKKAKDVKINQNKIKEFCEKKFIVPKWESFFHFKSPNYFLILDSINFCFWNKKKRWEVSYEEKRYNGYYALALALKSFFEKEKPTLKDFSSISQKKFNSILQGGENLQFLEERWNIVRTVSSEIIKKYESFEKMVESSQKIFSFLVPKIAELYSFEDPFLKRAQILACDLYGSGLESFEDLEYLTAFADYRVPQILNHFGILEYSECLNKIICSKTLIPSGSKKEKEIRAGTIVAVEYLSQKTGLYPFQVDWALWNKSQKIKLQTPYHLTKTIHY